MDRFRSLCLSPHGEGAVLQKERTGWLDRSLLDCDDLLRRLGRQQGDEVVDGCAELAFVRAHHEVDGIEVGFTTETAAEIGAAIDG